MYFFNLIPLIYGLLNLKVFLRKLYVRMAHFIDYSGEL